MIPLFKPTTGEAEAAAVASVLASGWLGTGPEVAAFEREFAAYIGVTPEQCVATNSGTAALMIACELARFRQGHGVPALTFVADPEAMLVAGGHWPLAVDVAEMTLAAAWPCGIHVHYAGLPTRPQAPIEDCAHAMGARLDGRHVGTLARFGCYSFHAVKNLATGDGGMLVCNDPGDAARARAMAWHGINRDTHQRTDRQAYSWEYDVSQTGIKGRMNDIAAAIGRVQLARLDDRQAARRRIADLYDSGLAGVAKPLRHDGHAWHLYVIRHPERDKLAAYLRDRAIQTGVHYRPWTEYAPYRQETPPVTARVWRTLLSLPMYPTLAESDQALVIEAVNTFARAGA
jgi:dTDP-4-amino-4,6-dideoxygalactose transaminase